MSIIVISVNDMIVLHMIILILLIYNTNNKKKNKKIKTYISSTINLYRLRKAQRLREEVALGQQKTSIQRLWPGIQIQILQSMAEKSESVISSDGEIIELLPISWITDITNKSIVTGQVSPSQRLLVIERDIQILKFIDHVSLNVENVLKNSNLFLNQVRDRSN